MMQPPLKPQNAPPSSAHVRSSNAAGERPGCVTAYAVLLGIAGVMFALGGILMSEGDDGLLLFVGGIVGALLCFVLARGLWRMRRWARVLALVVVGLGIAGNLFRVSGLFTGDISGQVLVSGVIGLFVGGIIWVYLKWVERQALSEV